jgi:hypothetical protein
MELLSREAFASIREAQACLNAYVSKYNEHLLHKGIEYQTPASIPGNGKCYPIKAESINCKEIGDVVSE